MRRTAWRRFSSATVSRVRQPSAAAGGAARRFQSKAGPRPHSCEDRGRLGRLPALSLARDRRPLRWPSSRVSRMFWRPWSGGTPTLPGYRRPWARWTRRGDRWKPRGVTHSPGGSGVHDSIVVSRHPAPHNGGDEPREAVPTELNSCRFARNISDGCACFGPFSWALGLHSENNSNFRLTRLSPRQKGPVWFRLRPVRKSGAGRIAKRERLAHLLSKNFHRCAAGAFAANVFLAFHRSGAGG